MKFYFLWKTMKKYLWMSSAAVVIGAWRVKLAVRICIPLEVEFFLIYNTILHLHLPLKCMAKLGKVAFHCTQPLKSSTWLKHCWKGHIPPFQNQRKHYMLWQGSQSLWSGAWIRPHSKCQKVSFFFLNSKRKIPNLTKYTVFITT